MSNKYTRSPERKKILKDIEIDELSIVDDPAHVRAKAVLIKRNGTDMTIEETLKKLNTKLEEMSATLSEQEERFTKLEKAMSDTKKMTEEDVDKAKKMEEEEADKMAEEEAKKKEDVSDDKKMSKKAALYKSSTGQSYYTESEAALAKQNDAFAQRVAALEKINREASLQKQVAESIPNLTGDSSAKLALWGALDSIADDTLRKSAKEILVAADNSMGDLFKSLGSSSGSEVDLMMSEPAAKLDKMARDLQTKTPKMTYEQAYDAALNTVEGRDLYTQLG